MIAIMTTTELENLRQQLCQARKEIKNLRQEIKTLNHVHRKEVDHIQNLIKNFNSPNSTANSSPAKEKPPKVEKPTEEIPFKPIGVIRTSFPEKRAIPRQAAVASNIVARIELHTDVFTNPSHSLEGLADFSHVWVIYHFHRNSPHPKAKVAPPRLQGERVGVFSTRSPHRPCPIGLSLVQLDRVDGSTILFYGTDMVDGTPVLDVKPYIPHYDSPSIMDLSQLSLDDGQLQCREAPDGEEATVGAVALATPTGLGLGQTPHSSPTVKVPNWVLRETTLSVSFNENAMRQVRELGVDQKAIEEILKADPRSVYLRSRHGSQIYTFQLGENTVMCKFDDVKKSVLVLQVRKKVNTEDLDSV